MNSAVTPLHGLPLGSPLPVKVLVVEDHPIFLKGLVSLLGLEPDLRVVAEASNRLQALEAVDSAQPEVALVDLSLGEENGLDLIKDILFRAPHVRILVLSMHEEAVYRKRALAAGALGFCRKGENVDQLLSAIRTVAAGRPWRSPGQLEAEHEATENEEGAPGLQNLTDREFEVFGLMGAGLGTGEIALRLHIGVKTVETYKGSLKNKLGHSTSQELRRAAIDWRGREGRL